MTDVLPRVRTILPAIRISMSLMLSETVAFMIPPLLAVGLVGEGEDLMAAALAAAAPALGVVAGIPLVPALVRAGGARTAFFFGAAVLVASLLVYVSAEVTDVYALWIVAGLIAGIGQAIRWIVADAAVAAIADPGTRGRLMSIHETLRSTAIGFGPGAVAIAAADIRAGLLSALAFALLALVTSGAVPAGEGAVRHGRGRVAPWRLVPVAAAATAFLGGSLEAAAGTSVPIYGLGFGLGAGAAAALASASGFGNLATQYPAGMAMDRLGVRTAAILLAAVTAAAALALWPTFAAGFPAVPLMVVFGGTAGAFYTLAIVEATDASADATASVAVIALMYTLGSFCGPIAGNAALLAAPGAGLPMLLAAGAAAVALAHAATGGRRRP